jgi:hypothetical protein
LFPLFSNKTRLSNSFIYVNCVCAAFMMEFLRKKGILSENNDDVDNISVDDDDDDGSDP